MQTDPVARTVTVVGPPSIYIAPPQKYMLFIMYGDIYSSSVWITLQRPDPASPANGPWLQ